MHSDFYAIYRRNKFPGMKKRASFEIFVRQIRTTVRKSELCFILADRLRLNEHSSVYHRLHLSVETSRKNMTSWYHWYQT